ncbi:MAG: fibrobacter succinogenes major paralogous domain-containing protein [Dysgonamonadaceae bacterium]|jgi:uncharacterized protein (TIGR02145 family)|nr:fibrobacter succinogenes major paralogous domain-containing protein [Dysgonamonadaceae bacterium]
MTALFMLSANCAKAQVTIGSLADPQEFSILELVSNSRGLRLPQMSNANKNDAFGTDNSVLIAAGVDALGLQIFNIDTKCVETWNGVEWIQACICPPSVTDGQNTYSVGYLGAAGCWMTENLRTKTKVYGGGIADLSDNSSSSTTAPYYSYPTEGNVTPTTAKFDAHPEYGLLYNWVAASGLTGISTNEGNTDHEKRQGICPDGWHLPSDKEWSQLESEITNNNTNNKYGTGSSAGSNMKSQTPVVSDNTPFTTDGTSNTPANNGFNALLVGYVFSGSAYYYGLGAHFWSSSSYVSVNAWYRGVYEDFAIVNRNVDYKAVLFSVRCKKNE